MAYAPLLSLGQTLEHILHPHDQSLLLLPRTEKQLMRSLHKKVGFLLAFLDVIAPESNKKVIGFEKRIREAAYEAEDLIESHIYSKQILSESHLSKQFVSGWEQKYKSLQKAKEELDTISEDLLQMKESDEIEILQQSNCLPAASSKSGSTSKSVIVGFEDEFDKLQDLLVRGPPTLEIASIVGIGGLGKTTLARKVYNDTDTAAHFEICAWVTVSQHYREQQVLEDILKSIGDLNREQQVLEDILKSIGDLNHESWLQSIDKLAEKLYKRLKHKRFLIMMDDVWDGSALEKIKRLLPQDNNASRILVTTRNIQVVEHHACSIRLRLLTVEECWNLLRRMVFGEECCPPNLLELGIQIAKNCRGLPLVLVLLGGLLYKAERTVHYWEYVARKMAHTLAIFDDDHYFLRFLYNELPHRLRACILYMSALPEDYEIHSSKLIKLWVANRFITPDTSKTLEEVAEEYLKDLVDRNLIMVRQWTQSGEIGTCSIHDLVRDFCLAEAEKKFYSEAEYLPEVHDNLRHVSIFTDTLPKLELAHNRDLYVRSVRSVTFFSRNSPNDIRFVTKFRLLRILDALKLSLDEFPVELVQLTTLRYIALSFWLKHGIPTSISKLCNLEALIISTGKLSSIFNASFLPLEIWMLSQLRHLLFVRGFLPYPTEALINAGNNYVLFRNLRTLANVVNFRWTKEVLQMMPNLEKLVVSYEHDGRTEWSSYCFDNFVLLHQLEVLKCYFFGKSYMKYHNPLPVKFAFPHNLKRLTLSGCRISWKDMTIIGSLPNLRVLKLKFHAFEGSIWEPNNWEFRQLKVLLIHMTDLEHWKADKTHFPSLERLTLNYCYNLVEIPFGIGKIPTLQEIKLCGCRTSMVSSAEVIQEEQKKLGKNEFQVILKKDEDDANILS